ncbi:uncharacterized protein LOC124132092 [Haliotis rufescens]|uniref:uncharacterized protein LOC124132092 n=1 Tax=Haliotis rufescens TaxID=6454 RepID=UPI00201EBB7E|nr:uncharacterized protein LOC124132092 [Haliotis rufescens]
MFKILLAIFLFKTAQLLQRPYPPGSQKWCFSSTGCPDDECCVHVTESDGRFGRRGVAPPGRCFTETSDLRSVCMRSASDRAALPRRCNDGDDCADDECCADWVQGPGFGRRGDDQGVYLGVCDKLGHYDSDCRADHFNSSNNPRPDGLVKSCPCNVKYNCTLIDDADKTLGICT